MSEEKLNLLQLGSRGPTERAQVRCRSCGANLSLPILAANSLTTCQTSFSVTPSPQGFPALLTFLKSLPAVGRFVCKASHCSKAEVNCARGKVARL